MLDLSKKILEKVSFDKNLFKKELYKSVGWINKKGSNCIKSLGTNLIFTI